MECQMEEPVNPFTTAGKSAAPFWPGRALKNFRAALAVSFIFSAARWRTPSGRPSPQTSAGKMA